MQRTWTEAGRSYTDERRWEWEKAIREIEWLGLPEKLPAMPGLAIQSAIRELKIPNVSNIGINHGLGLYGIEGNYKNGKAKVYLVDSGTTACVIASDFWPKEG